MVQNFHSRVIPCLITNMTPPEFLQIWCGEGVYGLTQPHQILSETIKYSWICGHLNVAILTIFSSA